MFNDDILSNIIFYLPPVYEYITLLKNFKVRQNYIKYFKTYNQNITKKCILKNCYNMFYLFLFEKNNATKEDIDELFMVMDFDHNFIPPNYYELNKIFSVIKKISKELIIINYSKCNLKKYYKDKNNIYNKKTTFNICNKPFLKHKNYFIYALNLIDTI